MSRYLRSAGGLSNGRSEKVPLTERLYNLFFSVTRWASSGLPTASPGAEPKSRRGCFHPLSLLKVIVVLLAVVFCPLFLLPIMLVRFAQTGRQTIKFSSSLDVASGEQARWGFGVLEPVPGAAAVQAGTEAIATRDPGFNAGALTSWAEAAAGLICESLTSGESTPARTFMANGLFRTHQALLELRTRAEVLFDGSWRAVDATAVQVVSTPWVDEVRVRVRCQGWRWERHVPSGLTLRGGPEPATWSEDLTFGRSAGTVTPSTGGLPARHCPSCGAQLELDANGVCQYCRGIVTAGRHDWVLVGWRSEPW